MGITVKLDVAYHRPPSIVWDLGSSSRLQENLPGYNPHLLN